MIFMAKIKIIAQPFFRETCISVSEMRSRTIPPQAEGNSPLLEVGVYTLPLRVLICCGILGQGLVVTGIFGPGLEDGVYPPRGGTEKSTPLRGACLPRGSYP